MAGPESDVLTKSGPEESIESLRRKITEYERWFRFLDGQNRVLERERQKLSTVVNRTDAGFLAFDPFLKVMWVNEQARRLLETASAPGSLLGAKCHEILCHAEAPCEECPAAQPFVSGASCHSEMRLEIEGRPRQIYATAMPIVSPSGEVEETIVMLQDLSDLDVLRRSQEALRASEEMFRSIFENTGAGMATVSPEGRFLRVNPALCNFLGRDEAELLGMTVLDVTHPDDFAKTMTALADNGPGSGRTVELENRYLRAGGEVLWGHVTAVRVFNESGTARYSVSLVQDVTERRRAEDALRRSEARLRRQQDALLSLAKHKAMNGGSLSMA
ncbi:MAG: PAS domain-containing protein, partial [Thermoanaerobaculia bacterium]